MTALLRLDDPRQQLAKWTLNATLELHPPRRPHGGDRRTDRAPRDRADCGAGVEPGRLARVGLERRSFFTGELLRRELGSNLTFSEPYRPGRIPVVLVHGTVSSAGRWADMVNSLENDRRVQRRFQFWFFHYATSSPIPYSAMLLRDALTNAVVADRSRRQDPALRDPGNNGLWSRRSARPAPGRSGNVPPPAAPAWRRRPTAAPRAPVRAYRGRAAGTAAAPRAGAASWPSGGCRRGRRSLRVRSLCGYWPWPRPASRFGPHGF